MPSVTVFGKVVGKARPRFTRRGRAYTPKATVEFEQRIRDAWLRAGHPCALGPVKVQIVSIRPLPKSAPKRRNGEPDVFKPDADNIAKAVLDALNGYAYKDDSQVTGLAVAKWNRYRDSAERLEISVLPTEEADYGNALRD